MSEPTRRERFVTALEGGWSAGLAPDFELAFFLTMEAFGRVHPRHRSYLQWGQMCEIERRRPRDDMADLFVQIAERFGHDAIMIHLPLSATEEFKRVIDKIREATGDRYFLCKHGDATFGVPSGRTMVDFSYRLVDELETLK